MLYPWFEDSSVDLILNILASVFTGALEICRGLKVRCWKIDLKEF